MPVFIDLFECCYNKEAIKNLSQDANSFLFVGFSLVFAYLVNDEKRKEIANFLYPKTKPCHLCAG